MMAEGNASLLKILCIHGYRQNGPAFKDRTGALRKIIKKHAELVFVTAPNEVPPLATQGESKDAEPNADQRGWWFSRDDNYYEAGMPTECVKGFQESIDVVSQAFKENGPFDGVLGFSQGASLVSIMCGMLQQQKQDCPFQFKFAILVAGFKSRSSPHDVYYKDTITLPTLHVYGDTDRVIPKELSEDLLRYFSEPVVLGHPGGHFIPASSPQKKVYHNFLEDMRNRLKSS